MACRKGSARIRVIKHDDRKIIVSERIGKPGYYQRVLSIDSFDASFTAKFSDG